MKILFCSPNLLKKELGAPKVLIELAEELGKLEWECSFISPADIERIDGTHRHSHLQYSEKLRLYLQQHAAKYDVVDYDHGHLPYPRQDFPSHTLFVARSVLLTHHFDVIQIPTMEKGWKSIIRSFIAGKSALSQHQQSMRSAQLTVSQADIVNVSNYQDKAALVRCGIAPEKIFVLPYGISRDRRYLFDSSSSTPPLKPKVTFVGTFDYRKGAIDFPKIVENICRKLPEVSFRFLGTAGMHRTTQEVFAYFPHHLRCKIEAIPEFLPHELPNLLSDCSIGIFPSYVEGFPFGVLEMLAASLPVIAYNSPGLPMSLPPECLVPPGDTQGMSNKVVWLLNDPAKLVEARIWSKQRSQQFCWEAIAKQTSEIYLEQWQRRQNASTV